VLLLLALVLAASLIWRVHPWYDGEADSSMYILSARSLLRGEGYACLGIPFIARPPGYPVLLTPVLALFGTDFTALNIYSSLFALGAALLLYCQLEVEVGALLAAAVALFVWFSPVYERMASQPLSDMPGLVLILATLCLERAWRHRPSVSRDVLLALLIGAATYVRSVCILLAPAIVLSRWLRRPEAPPEPPPEPPIGRRGRLREALVLLVLPLLLQIPWQVRNQRFHPEAPVDQTSLYSYSTAMFHADEGDPASPLLGWKAIARRVPKRAEQVVLSLGNRLGSIEPGAAAWILGGALLAASLASFALRREPRDAFVLANAALLLVYFDFARRLTLPIFVLSIASAAALAHGALARRAGTRRAAAVLTVLVLALAALGFRPRAAWPDIERRHRDFAEACAALGPHVEPGQTLASGLGWHYSVFLDRPVYSLYWAARRQRVTAAAEDVIDRYGVEMVLLSTALPFGRLFMPHFENRYPLVAQWEHTYLFRVR
jgi:4-amino-4-deoxy-L-arabinose transferase-like glycosyltransferase